MTTCFLAHLLGILLFLPAARSGWDQDSNHNVVVYWGQNSGNVGQSRLSYYCENAPGIDVINVSFLVGITNPNLNLANVGDDCTAFSQAPGLLRCPQVEADIIECQQRYKKTIMMSLFGSTYTESGFSSPSAAMSAAREVWAMFGPPQGDSATPRPFGAAVVDGFDFDIENPVENNMEPFAAELRKLLNDDASKPFYLSAAPQCPYPDAADQSFLDGQVAFDWVNVQFYNNACGVSHYPVDFNWQTWDDWAKTVSANAKAKVLIGLPASVGAANAGSFPTDAQLSGAISLAKSSPSFGGVMIWDMAQLFANAGYLAKVVSQLGSGSGSTNGHPPPPPPPSSSSSFLPSLPSPLPSPAVVVLEVLASSSALNEIGPPLSAVFADTVPQWGQCGGIGYTGPTQCALPFTCNETSEWWSQCK